MSATRTESIGLPEALERAASALAELADRIRPANGDPHRLAGELDAAAAGRVLAWLLRNEPAAGAELIGVWAEEAGTQDVVTGLEPEGLPKEARKALRRARHRLRSRGVALPESPPSARVVTLPSVDDRVDEARVTALDPRGVRLVYLATDHPAGGVRLFELALDDERGVVDFDLFSTGRRRVRQFLRDIEQREHWPAVPAPAAAARALIARAAARQAADRPAPRGFGEWRRRLCDVPEGTPTPGQIVCEALGGVPKRSRELLEAEAERVRTGRRGPWPPPLERVQRLVTHLEELADGVVVVSRSARREQVDRRLEEALGEIYDETLRERSAERFEESAYVDWKSGREDEARSALAAARAFREDAAGSNPVSRAVLEAVLAPLIDRALDPEEKPEAAAEPGEAAGVGEA